MARGFTDTLREGILGPLPEAGKFGLVLWRASIVLVPLLCLVAWMGASSVAQQARDGMAALQNPLVILFTLGMVLIFVLILAVVAAVAEAVGMLALIVALPLALLLAWSLGRQLDEGDAWWAPLVVGALGLASMPLLTIVSPILGVLALAPGVAGIAVAVSRRKVAAQPPAPLHPIQR